MVAEGTGGPITTYPQSFITVPGLFNVDRAPSKYLHTHQHNHYGVILSYKAKITCEVETWLSKNLSPILIYRNYPNTFARTRYWSIFRARLIHFTPS